MLSYRFSPRHGLARRYAAMAEGARPEIHIPVDVVLDEDVYVLTAYLPGVTEDEIKIEVLEDIVSLQGDFPAVEYAEEAQVLLQERPHGAFSRKLRLPTELDAAKATAEVKDGILTLSVPKAETAKAREVKVKVSK